MKTGEKKDTGRCLAVSAGTPYLIFVIFLQLLRRSHETLQWLEERQAYISTGLYRGINSILFLVKAHLIRG